MKKFVVAPSEPVSYSNSRPAKLTVFSTLEEAQDYLLERLHCAGTIYYIHDSELLENSVNEALEVLMHGRTFFDGYFDPPIKQLSRIDAATKLLLIGKGELLDDRHNQ